MFNYIASSAIFVGAIAFLRYRLGAVSYSGAFALVR
jgi:hypothetical protein